MAIPSFFSPVVIGDDLTGQSFVGGAIVTTNPTRELITEAGVTFQKDISLLQVLSLGHGTPRVLSVDELATTQGVNRSPEDLEVELRTRVDEYLRLGVISGMEDISIDKWSVLGAIRTHTEVYLGKFDVSERLDGFLRRLYKTSGIVTLEKIGGLIQIQKDVATVYSLMRKSDLDFAAAIIKSSDILGPLEVVCGGIKKVLETVKVGTRLLPLLNLLIKNTENMAQANEAWTAPIKTLKSHLATVQNHRTKLAEDRKLNMAAPPLDPAIVEPLKTCVRLVWHDPASNSQLMSRQ